MGSFRSRLETNRAPSFGSWISSPSLVGVDALRRLPFEWFMIDTEHGQLNPETVGAMVALLGSAGPAPFVRVGNVDPYLIKQALDAGAQGILAPLVNTVDQARVAVSFAKYPPKGVRGAAASAASHYGLDLARYLRGANDETVIGVQIETGEALENVDAIAAVDGVDLLFVGPTDLTLSLGLVDDRANPRIRDAKIRVVSACEQHGKIAGTLVLDANEKRDAIELGFRFIGLASDMRFLLQGAKSFLDA